MKYIPGRRDHGRSSSDRLILLKPFGLGVIGVVCLALVAGGASRLNLSFAVTVELAALVLLVFATFRAARSQVWSTTWAPLCILLFILAIPLVQLAPTPWSLWRHLPSRALPASILAAAGLTPPWMPISITPYFTQRSGLALVVPAAVFLATLTLRTAERRAVIMAIFGITLLSLLLGAVQVASGDNNAGYIYSSTSFGSLVGFFANRNHEATLLVCILPLIAAVMARGSRDQQRTTWVLSGGFVLLVLAALAVVQSRAGIVLFAPAIVASLAIVFTSGAFSRPKRTITIIGLVLALGVLFISLFALSAIVGRFHTDNSIDPRFYAAGNIFHAALGAMPIGTGLGSFDNIYRSIEPLSVLNERFLNHAHDDYLEVFLETGLAGVLAIVIFVIWWALSSWKAWSNKDRGDRALAQAGSTIILLIMLHSTVDYPMRTLAISAIFGFACALLAPPLSYSRSNQTMPKDQITSKFSGVY